MGAQASTFSAATPFPLAWLPEVKTSAQLEEAVIAVRRISTLEPDEFLRVRVPLPELEQSAFDLGKYEQYATAAMASDIGLNRLVYKLVPKRVDETRFWRCFFCWVYHTVAAVIDASSTEEESVAEGMHGEARESSRASPDALTPAQIAEVRATVSRVAQLEDEILIELIVRYLEGRCRVESSRVESSRGKSSRVKSSHLDGRTAKALEERAAKARAVEGRTAKGREIDDLVDLLLPDLSELHGVRAGQVRMHAHLSCMACERDRT